ncbi:MAG: hypothetical protein ABSE89_06900 [Sedimentisphaerales bacterium]
MKKLFCILAVAVFAANCPAVTSKIVRQKSMDDFSKGKTQDTVINSRGNITLAAATQLLSEDFNDVWVINSIVRARDGSIYIGTSPDGKIFRFKDGKTECIYPLEKKIPKKPKETKEPARGEPVEPNEPNEPNKPASTAKRGEPQVVAEKHIQNLHVFKLAIDSWGKVLAGISGDKCSLIRIDGKTTETIFEPNETSYIFAIELDKNGNIFLGTGPQGKIWRLDNKGKNPQLIYKCKDKNVLSLAMGSDEILYAGTDTRGLIYKIEPDKKTTSVLYDSSEDEITDLLFDNKGSLYAAATSYKSIKAQLKESPEPKPFVSGRPENKDEDESSEESASVAGRGTSLKIANTSPDSKPVESVPPPENLERGRESSASHVYKIDPNGFVTDIFSHTAVFFALDMQNGKILVGTGNKAQVFSINPQTEIESLIYEDQTASQVTDIINANNEVYFCTANPPKLIMLKSTYAEKGSFESALIDAGQPAQWGKLQLDADIPTNTKVLLSARSGNVEDVNDPTFSNWTAPVRITTPTDLSVPLGRFCQYKLILEGTADSTPVIREVAAAFAIPNLAPKILEIAIEKPDKKANPGIFKIDWKAEDENGDQLLYKIDYRKTGRSGWIELKNELDKPTFEWDSRTVEDGTYEIRVTASDELSNDQSTKLTGSRISDPVIVDNTPPVIESHKLQVSNKKAVLDLKVKDAFSIIASLSYTIDSNEKWISTLPKDGIFDTMEEDFTITITDLKPGRHVLAVKISDAEGNTMYETFDVNIAGAEPAESK